MMLLSLATSILRDPHTLVQQNDTPDGLSRLAAPLLGISAGGAAIFGAVAGSYRGGLQTFYAAAKFPFFLLLPILLCLPAIHALFRACEVEVEYRRLSLATLVAMARTAVLLAAAGPVLWLIYSIQVDYHLAILMMVATIGVIGLPGTALVVRMLPGQGLQRQVAVLGSVGLLGLVMAQSGWLLRPFVEHPSGEIAFLRPVENDIFSSLGNTLMAATGNYQDWEPESAGVIGRRMQ